MKKQTITRRDLGILYREGTISACSKWDKIVKDFIEDMPFDESFEVPDSLIREAYNEANAVQKKLLDKYFTLPKSIIDTVSSLDDILKMVGIKLDDIIIFKNPITQLHHRINSVAVIDFVANFINEGWFPDFSNPNQYKYYPYLEFNSSLGRWVWCGCSYSDSLSSGAVAYYKSEKHAELAFKILDDWYNEYLNSFKK